LLKDALLLQGEGEGRATPKDAAGGRHRIIRDPLDQDHVRSGRRHLDAVSGLQSDPPANVGRDDDLTLGGRSHDGHGVPFGSLVQRIIVLYNVMR
jgi:hypothetical protein